MKGCRARPVPKHCKLHGCFCAARGEVYVYSFLALGKRFYLPVPNCVMQAWCLYVHFSCGLHDAWFSAKEAARDRRSGNSLCVV